MNTATRNALYPKLLIVALTLMAFALRVWQLDAVPPGWRDDELINSLVISQKVLDGEWAVYYADASGHEALYHALNAVMLGLFGPNILGIRLLSALLGTLTIPLTYLVGRRLFGTTVGLVAAATLAFSFWSLMYGRTGIRHILTPLLALAAFYFFWRGLTGSCSALANFTLAALCMGLGLYTYFASRGVPLILLAFCGYLVLFRRDLFKKKWPGFAVMFAVTALLALPLAITLSRQPESEARVSELAVPLVEARAGNFEPLRRHITTTLSMFHSDGDDEWLYNIPHRPVFGPIGALFFWSGLLIAVILTLRSLAPRPSRPALRTALAAPFLLLWWLAGISPGFISVPPASLGHAILAQPAVFIMAALPLAWVRGKMRAIVPLLAVVLVASVAVRDLPAYFQEWPQRGMVRFLYRADIHDVARYLNRHPEVVDFGITGLLAGPWDRLALQMGLNDERATAVRPRWYNPQRALLLEPAVTFSGFPDVAMIYEDAYERLPDSSAGGYRLQRVNLETETADPVCFQNGLCWLTAAYQPDPPQLTLGWRVERPLDLPPMPLISNPPPPGVYAGPRLLVFAHLLDTENNLLTGNDGLWVDPATLYAGDTFIQQHRFELPAGQRTATAVFGLYDPMTGERILTTDGRDSVKIEIGE